VCVFHVSLGYFVLVSLAFVVLGLISSVLSQEIGREKRLRNYLFCVEWDVKRLLSQSVSQSISDAFITKLNTNTINKVRLIPHLFLLCFI